MTINSMVTGGGGNINLTATGKINDLDDVGNNISTTGTLSLTAGGAIGDTSTLNISTGNVTVTSSGGNNINITDSSAFTVANIATGGNSHRVTESIEPEMKQRWGAMCYVRGAIGVLARSSEMFGFEPVHVTVDDFTAKPTSPK